VLVSGEPGIGKSRLVEPLEQRLAADPPLRVRWFCSPHESDRPLHPLIDQMERAASLGRGDPAPLKLAKLRALLGRAGRSDGETLAVFASLLSIPLDGPSAMDSATPEKRRELTIAALLAQLTGLSGMGPVLMVVEDAH